MFLASYWSVLDLIASVSVGLVYQDLDTTFNNFEVLRRGAEFKRYLVVLLKPPVFVKQVEGRYKHMLCFYSFDTLGYELLSLGDQTPQVFCFQVGMHAMQSS
ncbi:unnamed protein product [Brassica oleracea]